MKKLYLLIEDSILEDEDKDAISPSLESYLSNMLTHITQDSRNLFTAEESIDYTLTYTNSFPKELKDKIYYFNLNNIILNGINVAFSSVISKLKKFKEVYNATLDSEEIELENHSELDVLKKYMPIVRVDASKESFEEIEEDAKKLEVKNPVVIVFSKNDYSSSSVKVLRVDSLQKDMSFIVTETLNELNK